MKNIYLLFLILPVSFQAQVFTRSELPTSLTKPWEITYGPDNFLWITESGGIVSRVDPISGAKTVVYTASDYFSGSTLEQLPLCTQPMIGAGTLGLALHPDFLISSTSYIYFVYSYNSVTVPAPATKFKVKRLTWDAVSNTVINDIDLITSISTGYDHLGGRLMSIKQNGTPYLFLTIGDHGISEDSNPTCYSPQTDNPNNFAQDPGTQNGKIHRFNMDGTVPFDNPIAGNSFYTRGHRNTQGLMYNPTLDILYGIEHGDRTDDEINVLYKGMNYGWKNVRGYHSDNNFPGEAAYISSYIPDPSILNDSLVQAMYSFCATIPDASPNYSDWCTVAPSDGIFYGSNGIPEWTNSLLVVTLKNGLSTNMEVYQFHLDTNGELTPSTTDNPNPKKYFSEDQTQNGRLRDITVSPDGKKIYLINNYGAPTDKITVYEYIPESNGLPPDGEEIWIYPNPVNDILTINYSNEFEIEKLFIYNAIGQVVYSSDLNFNQVNTTNFKKGVYFLKITTNDSQIVKKFVKE